jgi:signal recognition particle subunit SRP68
MQLRQQSSLVASGKARRHLKKRLVKAVRWSEQLESAANSVADVKTSLEAQAYKATMAGNFALEQKDWPKALFNFETAREVYEKLSLAADSIQAVAYSEKQTALQPLIRYCENYSNLTPEDLIQMKASNSAESEVLNAQIEALLAESRQRKLESASYLEIRGRTFNITNERVRLSLQKAEECLIAVDSSENKLDLYSEAFAHYDEAIRTVKKVRDEKKSHDEVGEAEVWSQLMESVNDLKKARTVDRNYVIVQQTETKFECEIDQALRGLKVKLSRPQEMVKVYDNLLGSIRVLESDPREMQVRGRRAYYMSLVHLYNGKLVDAYALLQRVIELGYQDDKVQSLGYKLQAAIASRAQPPDIGTLTIAESASTFPPTLQPMVCKPVFYDLAWESLEYPDLSKRAQQGFFSKTWSRFFGS